MNSSLCMNGGRISICGCIRTCEDDMHPASEGYQLSSTYNIVYLITNLTLETLFAITVTT